MKKILIVEGNPKEEHQRTKEIKLFLRKEQALLRIEQSEKQESL